MPIINYSLFNTYLMLFTIFFFENVVYNTTYSDYNKIAVFTCEFYTLDFQNALFNYLHLFYNLHNEKFW